MSRRLWLLALLFLTACSDGGGGSTSFIETLNWPAFRRDPFNSGLGGSSIDDNDGQIVFEVPLQAPEGVQTLPVLAIGRRRNLYIGTADGLVALDDNGNEIWRFRFCNLEDGAEPCDAPSPTCIEVGQIYSTPAVNGEGDIIVSAGNGYVFFLRDENVEHQGSHEFTCRWAKPPAVSPSSPVLSSPQVILDSIDQAITSVFVGTNNGWLQALNGNGSEKWRFPADAGPFGPVTSTVALNSAGTVHFIAPDGFLYSLNSVGRLLWSAEIGVEAAPFPGRIPSPSVNVSTYAVGAGGKIYAFNPNGTEKWQFQAENPVPGSTSFVNQFVSDLVDDREETRLETIVRVVDEKGIIYGIRDRNGLALDARLCSVTTDVACETIDDCSGEDTCDLISVCTGTGDRCVTNEDCTTDQTCDSTGMRFCSGTDRDRACFFDGDCAVAEACIVIRRCSESLDRCLVDSDCPSGQTCNSSVRLVTDEPTVPVSSSPAVSTDLYTVVGTDDGRLCARRLDEIVPEQEIWATGCISIAPGKPLSSPVIDLDGTIYVASDEKLYAIGTR